MTNEDYQFITALENGDLEALQKVPKADLHNHCFLGGNREYILMRTGKEIPLQKETLKSMHDMHHWIGQNVADLLETLEGRTLALEATFVQAASDGVTVLEIGEDVWANGHYYHGKIEDLINTFQTLHHRFAPQTEFKFQMGLSRHCPIELLEEWSAPFLERDCFYSIDLYSDELAQPIKNFKPIYRRAKEKGPCLKGPCRGMGQCR